MRQFFSAKSRFQIVLSILTLAFALNSANGTPLPASSQPYLQIENGLFNRMANGPTLPPPVDEDLRIANGPTLPPPVDEDLRIANGPTLAPPVDEDLRIANGPTLPPPVDEDLRIAA
jgi:hypothetical protein